MLNKGLRIVHFYKHYLESGGIPRETELLAKFMAKCPDVEKVFVYCLTPIRAKQGEFKDGPITVRAFYIPRILYNLKTNVIIPRQVAVALNENVDRADVYILTGSFIAEHFMISRILTHQKYPYVVSVGEAFNPNSFYGTKGLRKRIWNTFFEKFVINHAVAIRIYSEDVLQHVRKYGYQTVRTFIVKEGIDYKQVPRLKALANLENVTSNVPIFGYLGRFDLWKKGVDLLLLAFDKYKCMGGKGILLLCGFVEGRNRLSAIISRLKWGADSIRIVGPFYGKEKVDFLMSISMLCTPSRHEGIPRVIREALAMGRPVMVTPNTNMHDIVNKHRAGIVVEDNVKSIVSGLFKFEKLAPHDKARMARNAFNLSIKLNWSNIAAEYVKYLRKVLHEVIVIG